MQWTVAPSNVTTFLFFKQSFSFIAETSITYDRNTSIHFGEERFLIKRSGILRRSWHLLTIQPDHFGHSRGGETVSTTTSQIKLLHSADVPWRPLWQRAGLQWNDADCIIITALLLLFKFTPVQMLRIQCMYVWITVNTGMINNLIKGNSHQLMLFKNVSFRLQ